MVIEKLPALERQGEVEGAIASSRKALEIDPRNAEAHTYLGLALGKKGDVEGAIAAHRKALQIEPHYAIAHKNLGVALGQKGDLEGAIAADRKAMEFFPEGHPQRPSALRQLRFHERLLSLEKDLPAIVSGMEKPSSPAENLDYARLCLLKKLPVAAVRLYADAFAAEPKLAEDPRTGHRFAAARGAVLAASGTGEDAAKLEQPERMRHRQQALDWLRADIQAWTQLLETASPQVRQTMRSTLQHWQRDVQLASVRDAEALAQLTEPSSRPGAGSGPTWPDGHLLFLDATVHAIGIAGHQRLAYVFKNLSVEFRLLGDTVQHFPNGRDESGPSTGPALFVPVRGLIELVPCRSAKDDGQTHLPNLARASASTCSHGTLSHGLAA